MIEVVLKIDPEKEEKKNEFTGKYKISVTVKGTI